VDSHPVVASQLSFECWFLLLTTLRTLSIPSLASILYILPFQLRADINRFRVQLRLLLTPSIPPRQALLRRDFPELVFTTASLRLQYYLFHQFFTLRSGYPEPAQKQQHLFWKTSRHFFSLFGILRSQPLRSAVLILLIHFFTSRARVLITLPSDDAAVIWHSFCFTFRPALLLLLLPHHQGSDCSRLLRAGIAGTRCCSRIVFKSHSPPRRRRLVRDRYLALATAQNPRLGSRLTATHLPVLPFSSSVAPEPLWPHFTSPT
jgi:hypothetical protein